jgi:hypothetical protein
MFMYHFVFVRNRGTNYQLSCLWAIRTVIVHAVKTCLVFPATSPDVAEFHDEIF